MLALQAQPWDTIVFKAENIPISFALGDNRR